MTSRALRRRLGRSAVLAVLLGAGVGTVWADAAAGRRKAQACAVCHGPLGVSVTPDAPNLAAQPEVYLSRQLGEYRSGKRQHEVMNVMARTLSDEDIRDLAAWFASLRVEVREGP